MSKHYWIEFHFLQFSFIKCADVIDISWADTLHFIMKDFFWPHRIRLNPTIRNAVLRQNTLLLELATLQHKCFSGVLRILSQRFFSGGKFCVFTQNFFIKLQDVLHPRTKLHCPTIVHNKIAIRKSMELKFVKYSCPDYIRTSWDGTSKGKLGYLLYRFHSDEGIFYRLFCEYFLWAKPHSYYSVWFLFLSDKNGIQELAADK